MSNSLYHLETFCNFLSNTPLSSSLVFLLEMSVIILQAGKPILGDILLILLRILAAFDWTIIWLKIGCLAALLLVVATALHLSKFLCTVRTNKVLGLVSGMLPLDVKVEDGRRGVFSPALITFELLFMDAHVPLIGNSSGHFLPAGFTGVVLGSCVDFHMVPERGCVLQHFPTVGTIFPPSRNMRLNI